MKLRSAMFWVYLVVVLYLVSMLVYVSIEFFGGADANKISAFGSVLGGIGTFFAAFVAIYLFNDWKEEQHFNNRLKLINETSNSCNELCDELRIMATPIAKVKNYSKIFISKSEEKIITIDELEDLCDDVFERKLRINKQFRRLQVQLNRCQKYFKDNDFKVLKYSVILYYNKFHKLKNIDVINLMQLESDCKIILDFITEFTKIIEDEFILKLDEKSSPFYKNL